MAKRAKKVEKARKAAKNVVSANPKAPPILEEIIARKEIPKLDGGPKPSKYEQLMEKLNPHLQGKTLSDLKPAEIKTLAKETKIPQTQIRSLKRSEKSSKETGLPSEVFYGLAKKGLSIDLMQLFENKPADIRTALKGAIKEGIIPDGSPESFKEMVKDLEGLRPKYTNLTDFAKTVGLKLPPKLVGFLKEKSINKERSINTILDIRNNGGISHIKDLPVKADDPIIRTLEAYADLDRLSRLSSDVKLNSKLIKKGYNSVLSIANVPRSEFVNSIHEEVGDFKAARLHVEADAQTKYLNNLFTGFLVDSANRYETAEKAYPISILDLLSVKCSCNDCEAAVSPLAYLADLLDYTLKHLKTMRNGLKAEYRNNFGSLISTRIDPEVNFVWDVDGTYPFPISSKEVLWLGKITPRYSETYTFYTESDGEIRFLIDGELISRKGSLSSKNGTISLTAGNMYNFRLEYIAPKQQILLDQKVLARLKWSSPSQVKEVIPKSQLYTKINVNLQFLSDTFHQLFGKLPASCEFAEKQIRQVRICIEVLRSYMGTRPLADVAKETALVKAEKAYQLAAYTAILTKIGTSLDEIRLARSADQEMRKELAERLGIDLGAPRPDHLDRLFLDPTTVPVTLTEQNLEAIFGLRNTTREPVTDTPSPSSLEKWRLEHLRTLWKEQDWPNDPYYENFQPIADRLPIIGPDIIGPDDFRNPVPKANSGDPDKAFDIWLKRRTWVDARIQALSARTKVVRGQQVPDLGLTAK